ncbi:MAG: hypothetical protein RI935_125 [Candidatus Parcubacteria bacterium]|jgi:hypothetical protein
MKALYTKISSHITTIIFLFGFVFDMLILPDVDNPLTKYIGGVYIVVIAILIAFREWLVSRNTASKAEQKLFSLASFGIAYFSGAALSFIFVYALRSAALSVSWPLFVILLLCMIANEGIKTHTYRFMLDIMVLFVATVFYIVFNAPFFVLEQNDGIFYVSIVASIFFSLLFVTSISKLSEITEEETGKMYSLACGIPMFIAMLYFLNMIPAVPLSLTESDVFHYVEKRTDGTFFVKEEERDGSWFKYIYPVTHTMFEGEEDIFFMSSVRAPQNMEAALSHVWEYYDRQQQSWIAVTSIPFTISGGRKSGFRAYSKKENIFEGSWRVTVKVGDNRVVGRYRFNIERGSNKELLTRIID